MPRGLRHVALSISFLSPMARRPDALFTMNMASLIFLPDVRFLVLSSFHSLNGPSLSFGSSSRSSLRKQSFSVSRPRLRPPGNIHSRSRLLLTNKTRPRFVATSFDDFAIAIPHRLYNESSVQVLFHPLYKERRFGFEICGSGPLVPPTPPAAASPWRRPWPSMAASAARLMTVDRCGLSWMRRNRGSAGEPILPAPHARGTSELLHQLRRIRSNPRD